MKQVALVTNNENKQLDIKDFPKAAEKQDTAQENLEEKLATFQNIIIEATTKIESNTTISEEDKAVLQNRISEIARTVKTFLNKTDVDTIIKSMEVFANGKITKSKVAVVEEDLNEIIEQQIKLDQQIRTEKLAIFQNVVADIAVKLESNTTVNPQDKDIMQNSIKDIVSKVQKLANTTDIETITENIEELIRGKLTKARIAVVEEDVDQLIEQQNKPNHDVTVNKVEEIIYDNWLLNHSKLVQAAVDSKLSSNLIHEAVNNNDEELILAGLVSVGYDITQIN
ncbi:MAG: hypothetical protein LN546_05245 [Rickettsia endosymbiont of Ecitomorpha arachnoides]|nr:hypothetical protein [Rickettsia endosymbiont of Ecitomorpha arachnoides]